MKLIPLTGKHGAGKFTMVDDADYEWLSLFSWRAIKGTIHWYSPTTWCAGTSVQEDKGNYCISKTIAMHVMIQGTLQYKCLVDHKDHNGLNNQRKNIRRCNHSQNAANRHAVGMSSFLGVAYNTERDCWVAQIKTKTGKLYLGSFPFTRQGEIAAAIAYDKVAILHHGEFANLNFKDGVEYIPHFPVDNFLDISTH